MKDLFRMLAFPQKFSKLQLLNLVHPCPLEGTIGPRPPNLMGLYPCQEPLHPVRPVGTEPQPVKPGGMERRPLRHTECRCLRPRARSRRRSIPQVPKEYSVTLKEATDLVLNSM